MNNKTISIFDLDDTLLITPTFSALIPKAVDNETEIEGEFSDFFKKIQSFFLIIFSKEIYFVSSGDYISVYDRKTRAPLKSEYLTYIQDLDRDSMASYGLNSSAAKDVVRALEAHGGQLVFRSIPKFHENPKTIGKIVNDDVFRAYNEAENKMILTGRRVSLKPFIEGRLKELGLELPNYGLYCFSGGNISVQDYKIQTILDTIEENNWTQVHFYEDRKDWLESANKSVSIHYPQVDFYPHLITIPKSY